MLCRHTAFAATRIVTTNQDNTIKTKKPLKRPPNCKPKITTWKSVLRSACATILFVSMVCCIVPEDITSWYVHCCAGLRCREKRKVGAAKRNVIQRIQAIQKETENEAQRLHMSARSTFVGAVSCGQSTGWYDVSQGCNSCCKVYKIYV